MPGFFGKPGLGKLALAWLAVLITAAAGAAGMPPLVSARLASPQLAAPAGSIKVPEPEPPDLTPLAKIPADQAMAAALAAYPGARVRALALENDNGCLVYNVLLSNGLEVKVDAGNGRVLQSATEDEDELVKPKMQQKRRKNLRP